MGARAKEKEITGEPYTPVLPGDNPRWQRLQTTQFGWHRWSACGAGLEGEGEPVSAPRSLLFWPLPAKGGLSVSS